ncbi:MAG: minichromosome maintenance protein MCM [Candidatus Woesearchaeota archaeon]
MQEIIQKILDYISFENLEDTYALQTSIPINFFSLAQYDVESADFLLDNPYILYYLEETLQKKIIIYNLPSTQKISISNLRSKHLDKLICVEGIIRQKSLIRPKVTNIIFECTQCGSRITLLQTEKEIKMPYKCATCGTKNFKIIKKELIDVQSLIIEEPIENNFYDKAPRLRILLEGEELTSTEFSKKLIIGDKIEVTGILKELPIKSNTGKQSVNLDFYLEAIHISIKGTTFEEIYSKISEEDIKKITQIAQQNPFKLMKEAILPNIFGYDVLKEALVLLLFGGVRKEREVDFPLRGDFHLLLIGDPGTAKSSILSRMSLVAPKSRLISAASATGVGFTATLVKDEFLKGYALEAGALVLANGGLACIDELDKASDEDRKYLHQAMEQQIITISKANIQETLQCRTTILAAANPKLGRFDFNQPLAQQINLTPPLLNRFDLIFPIQDIPDENRDTKTAEFIIEKHIKRNEEYNTEENPFFDINFFRKYVAFARQNCFPTLTQASQKMIVDFYVSLRKKVQEKTIPITARQIEALIRLSEASAKTRLSDRVTKEDVERAINLLEFCLKNLCVDEGVLDIDKLTTGITSSFKKKYYSVWQTILELDNGLNRLINVEDLQLLVKTRYQIDDLTFYDILEKMNKNGDIIEPKKGFIQVIN